MAYNDNSKWTLYICQNKTWLASGKKAKNASHVHFNQSRGCLIQLLCSGGGDIDHLLPHGLLEDIVDEGGPSTVRILPAIKVYGFFLTKVKTLVKVDSDMLAVRITLRDTSAFQGSIATHFLPWERIVLLSFHTWLRATGKCPRSSFLILATKIILYCLGQWNFIWNIPIYMRIKCNGPQVPSSTGKGRVSKFIPVMFYCSDRSVQCPFLIKIICSFECSLWTAAGYHWKIWITSQIRRQNWNCFSPKI